MLTRLRDAWRRFSEKRPGTAQFVVFLVLSNGITVLQLALMPLIKWLFGMTALVDATFQVWPIGSNPDGSQYFVFDYAAGALPAGGGGLAYFLAVQITLVLPASTARFTNGSASSSTSAHGRRAGSP